MSEQANTTQRRRPATIRGDEFALRFLAALGIDGAKSRRLIIDCEAQHVMRVYVEYYGDARVLDIQFPGPGEVEIRGVPGPAPESEPYAEITAQGDEYKTYLPPDRP
jgi:hypothetical protein